VQATALVGPETGV